MKKRGWTLFAVLVALAVAPFVVAVATPPERSYAFAADHPVDMWQDGGDRWSYYSVGEGKTADLASKARAVLLPQGFAEDASQRPWYRFVKGREEVVVCDHGEFEVDGSLTGSKLAKNRSSKAQGWPCVLVKNGPGTHRSVGLFQIQKLVHGW